MSLMFWDTETTGLPLYDRRSDFPGQPHIVQLGVLITDDSGLPVETRSVIVRPDGWSIPPEMTSIHGISHERAMDEGISETLVIAEYMVFHAGVDLRLAFNESFDRRIARIAMLRAGVPRDEIDRMEGRPREDVRTAATRALKLGPSEKMIAKGMKMNKTASLDDCLLHLFGEQRAATHDALDDARHCARVYFALQARAKGVVA